MEMKHIIFMLLALVTVYMLVRQMNEMKKDIMKGFNALREEVEEKNNSLRSHLQLTTNQCIHKVRNIATENLQQFRKINELNNQVIKGNHYTETEAEDSDGENALMLLSPQAHDLYMSSSEGQPPIVPLKSVTMPPVMEAVDENPTAPVVPEPILVANPEPVRPTSSSPSGTPGLQESEVPVPGTDITGTEYEKITQELNQLDQEVIPSFTPKVIPPPEEVTEIELDIHHLLQKTQEGQPLQVSDLTLEPSSKSSKPLSEAELSVESDHTLTEEEEELLQEVMAEPEGEETFTPEELQALEEMGEDLLEVEDSAEFQEKSDQLISQIMASAEGLAPLEGEIKPAAEVVVTASPGEVEAEVQKSEHESEGELDEGEVSSEASGEVALAPEESPLGQSDVSSSLSDPSSAEHSATRSASESDSHSASPEEASVNSSIQDQNSLSLSSASEKSVSEPSASKKSVSEPSASKNSVSENSPVQTVQSTQPLSEEGESPLDSQMEAEMREVQEADSEIQLTASELEPETLAQRLSDHEEDEDEDLVQPENSPEVEVISTPLKKDLKVGQIVEVDGKKKMVKKRHHRVKRRILSVNTSGPSLVVPHEEGGDEASVVESYLTLDTIKKPLLSESDSVATTDYAAMSKEDLLGLEEYTVNELKKINRAFQLPVTCLDQGKRRNYRKDELYGNLKNHLKGK